MGCDGVECRIRAQELKKPQDFWADALCQVGVMISFREAQGLLQSGSRQEEPVRARGSMSFICATLMVSTGPVLLPNGPRGPATMGVSGNPRRADL